MRFAAAAFVLVTLLAPGASALAAAPLPVYLQAGYGPDRTVRAGDAFALVSNGDWKVRLKGLVAPRIVRPQETRKADPRQSQAQERQDLAWVWAPTCTSDRQTVAFVRDAVLPGPPGDVSFEVDQLTFGGAIEKAVLFVNGRQALTLGRGGGRIEHDKTRTNAFRYGLNQLKVEVTKRAEQRRPCNTGRPEADFGVRFVVLGEFVADVAVRADLPATSAMKASNPQGINGTVEIFNNGPSGVYSGFFRLLINGTSVKDLLFREGPNVEGPGVTGCKSSVPVGSLAATKLIEITCKLRNMPPRTKALVTFRLAVTLVDGASYSAIRYAREVFASGDDPKNNNTLENTIRLCPAWDESADCANAK